MLSMLFRVLGVGALFVVSAFAEVQWVSFDCPTLPQPFSGSEEAKQALTMWANHLFDTGSASATIRIPPKKGGAESCESPSPKKLLEDYATQRSQGPAGKFTAERALRFEPSPNHLQVSFSIAVVYFDHRSKSWELPDEEKVEKVRSHISDNLNASGEPIGVSFEVGMKPTVPEQISEDFPGLTPFIVQIRRPNDPYWLESGNANLMGLRGVDRAHAFFQEDTRSESLRVGVRGTSAVIATDDAPWVWLHELTHFAFLSTDAYADVKIGGVPFGSKPLRYFKGFSAASRKEAPKPLELAVALWRLGQDAPRWEDYAQKTK